MSQGGRERVRLELATGNVGSVGERTGSPESAAQGPRSKMTRSVRYDIPWRSGLSAQLLRAACILGGLLLGAQTGTSQAVGGASALPAGPQPGAGATTGGVPQASTAVTPEANAAAAKPDPALPPLTATLTQYAGQMVDEIRYSGVSFEQSDRLVQELAQKQGEPFAPEKVRQTTRRLFATGRYRDIAVRVEKTGPGLILIFSGTPRYYVGRIQVDGVKEDRLTSLIEYGTKLDPGTAFSDEEVEASTVLVKQTLAQNGYYEPVIAVTTHRDDVNRQVDVTYTVAIGPQARVGDITLNGNNTGITEAVFRKKGKLKRKTRVGRETTSTALSNLRNYYQKKDHLEATVSLQKSTYDPQSKKLSYHFNVEQGPNVQVKVEGAKFSKSRLHLLVPVFEEGTVDNDLLNEGVYNMKDYLQQQGFFDAEVSVKVTKPSPEIQTVLYIVDKNNKHRVESVDLQGNKYFSTALLKDKLHVQKADAYLRSGRFSQALVKADESSIQSLYRANGFSAAKVTADVHDSEGPDIDHPVKLARISVVYKIDEGTQQKFGDVVLKGAAPEREQAFTSLLQAKGGQPFSLISLSGDRDAILSYYLSNGFDQARVEVVQKVEEADKSKTDVTFDITEGKQVFTGKVLLSGVVHTRPHVVDDQLLVHPGTPLDQSALLETQRNLYNLALFNEVVAAVQNPLGDAQQKNVLVQVTEAKRWDVTYGFGFEVQSGTPGCGQYCTQQGTTKAQQGRAGASPRVSVDVSRINLRGTQDSLTLHGAYGLLEQIAVLSFQNPHLYGSPRFSLQISGGYSNVQDITTFASSKLQGDFRVTHKATRKDTFIYDFQYRRIAVDANSLAIDSNLIPLLSQPVRVGGPGITWFHDTRTPSPLNAVKGSYTSVEDFFATSKVGSQTDFNRTDLTNSTYYQFGKGKNKYVFARNTRIGFIASYGTNPNAGNPSCATNAITSTGTVVNLLNTNASCNSVPLPERLYAGGATSIRGYPINGAGPRDLQTGFPVGGSGVFINTFELRLPPPTLPYVGDSVGFVLFHDAGNVFRNPGDIFPSFGRFHQPNEATCENVANIKPTSGPAPVGICDFRYFTHDLGLGARYNTPVGPIRVDLSYTLNPPRYPIVPQVVNGAFVNGQVPTVGQGTRFGFFFSIGQSF